MVHHGGPGGKGTTVSVEETRRRIVEATVELHEEVGPADTTITGIGDPGRRLRGALREIYAYFRRGAPMLEQVLRDEEEAPELAEVMESWWGWMGEVAGGLAAGWGVGAGRQRLVRAAVGHALRFSTWRSLDRQGLSDEEAVDMMAALVERTAGRGPGGRDA